MNNGSRLSRFLRRPDARKMQQAALRAVCMGLPLIWFVTINCSKVGITLQHVHIFNLRFLKLFGDWYRKRTGMPPNYIYVLENPTGRGLNVHYLMHLPPNMKKAFQQRSKSWIATAGGRYGRKGIFARPVDHSQPGTHESRYLEYGMHGSLRYLLKGLDKAACDDYGADHEPQGIITGKRCGFSESLSPARPWSTQHPQYPRVQLLLPESKRLRKLDYQGYHWDRPWDPDGERAIDWDWNNEWT